MITEKDRAQLLRMAGNIAAGIATGDEDLGEKDQCWIARASASLAYKTMLEIDKLTEEQSNCEEVCEMPAPEAPK